MKYLKESLFTLLALILIATVSSAQGKPSPPAKVEGIISGVEIVIDYHQPSAKGREVMGGLVPFDKVWRTGANDATTIEISEAIKVEGKKLSAGKYALFTIPGKDKWTIIFNTNHKQWGAYDYDKTKDALRVTVKPSKTDDFIETFNIQVTDGAVEMKWENTLVKFNISK